MIVQEPIQAAIWHCLNHYDFEDAVFLAERLCSEVETDETIFILATSYYRSNLIHQAYWLLKEKSRRSPHCRYLLARCACQLKKYSEAECALTNGFGDVKNFDEIVKDFGEVACFALQLIAQICVKTERMKIAAEALRRVLKLNPFMWNSYVDLLHLGEQAEPAAIFHIASTDVFNTCQGSTNTNAMVLLDSSGAGGIQTLNDSGGGIFGANLANMPNVNAGTTTPATTTTPASMGGNNTDGNCYNTPAERQQHATAAGAPLQPPMLILRDDRYMIMINNNNNNNNHNNSNANMSHNTNNVNIGSGNGNSNSNNNNSSSSNNTITLIPPLSDALNTTVSFVVRGSHNASGNMSGVMMLDDTPIGGDAKGAGGGGGGGGMEAPAFDSGAGTPFRRQPQFKYLASAYSPATPSFGVLSLNSPCASDSSFICGIGGTGVVAATLNQQQQVSTTPSPQMLVEVNVEQPKVVVGKKVRSGGHIGSLISRSKDLTTTPNAANAAANNNAKPAVFTQTGNITPRTPSNNNAGNVISGIAPLPPSAVMRRSSRLSSHNAYSVKENNKSPNIAGSKFAQPRSPPRKTKSRIAKICLNSELLIEDKCAEKLLRKDAKEKVETITTSTATGGGGGNSNGNNNNNNNNGSSAIDAKVLLNNSVNSAQTMAHHVLALKKQSADGLMALLRDLAEAYKQLEHYQCKAAIKHLEANIPKHHLATSWVQSLLGIANYELQDYETAVTIFKRIHDDEPYRLDYMEIYSSSLWHLQKEVELSALAQDLMQQDRLSPVTWCVAGNCFSLHKEHETAIKFFKRAVQLDADFVYSYTLLGHELVLTEELDKAMDYFRAAVVLDPRHYNAWFGIGTIYSKQEKYALAELHYIKALKIYPQNSVILVHIGAMQYFMQKKEQALQTLNTAATLDPKNPLSRFHRGSIYFSLGRHQEALRELEELKDIVPKESVVFYLIGKIHKALGNVDLALMHFSWATDLDPKGANNHFKDAFDSVSHPGGGCASGSGNSATGGGSNEPSLDADLEPVSDDSTQAQQDINYDSDVY